MNSGQVSLQGPKVHAERGETADAGGGRIQAEAGSLMIQGAVRGRKLGPVDQLGKVVFRDHRGRESEWTFGDGTRWTLRCESDELLFFSRDLASRLGRPSLVVEPPDPTAQLISATRERRLDLLFGLVAIGLVFAVRWLVGTAAWLGYALAIAALAWLGMAAAGHLADKRRVELGESGPTSLAPLSMAVHRVGAVVAWFAPLCVIAGALLGINDAAERSTASVVAEERRAAATTAEEAQHARVQASAAKRRTLADEKLAAAEAAMAADDLELAERLLDEAKAIEPDHPKLTTAQQALAPKLAAERVARRASDVVVGLGLARKVIDDNVLCEAAQPVADAWAKLSQTTPADETYEAAQKLVPKLERCRQRVAQTFGTGARTARAQSRQAWSSQLEQELRKRGVAASTKTNGPNADELVIQLDSLTPSIVEPVMGGSPSLSERASQEGFRRITLRAGRRKRVEKLKPKATDDVHRVLQPYGLAEPLALP